MVTACRVTLAGCGLLLTVACSDRGAGAPPGAVGSSAGAGASGAAGSTSSASGGSPSSSGGASATAGTAGEAASAGTAGVSAAGASAAGGAGGSAGSAGSAGAPPTDEWFPCDGDTSVYDVVVTGSGSIWTIEGAGDAETAGSIQDALTAAFDRLSPGRDVKESVLVQGDGSIAASERIELPSYLILNLCGTIDVTETSMGDLAPIFARGRTDIDIPHARISGNPVYGMFFRETSNLHLGVIELDLNPEASGIGIRVDNSSNAGAGGPMVTNIRVDQLTATGTGSHALETYGVDGLEVGRVDATDTGESGVLLNRTINAEVGVVHCENCGAGTGYAAFRIANDAGKIGSEWPAGNIHVQEVYARGGGRGIFSVSGSGGLTIDRIDIADTGSDGILLQNCYNTTICAESGIISGANVLLSNDTEDTDAGTFEPSQNVLLQNLTLEDASVSEAWCELGDRGNRAENITGGSVNMCFD